jgi:CelD/BcsL family acetyltransferase involved in cellulose biosynthesis
MLTAACPATLERVPVDRAPELARDWNELLCSSESDCIFLTWEWVSTWWKHLGAGYEWTVMAVSDGEMPTAIAPLCVAPRDIERGQFLRETIFMGTGFAGADYLDFIVRRGYEADSCTLFADELERHPGASRWNNLRRGECSAERVAACLQQRGWSVVESAINVCPLIPLHEVSWDDYLASLSSEHRYAFNRKWKKLNRDFAVQLKPAQNAEECSTFFESLLELHRLRWSGRRESDAFHTPELVAFHKEFAQLALARGWLRLYMLALNGQPAAALYGLFYRRKFYFFQSGLNPAYEKYSVGLVLMGLAIRAAIEEGADEYDFLHGDEVYKRHWARSSRALSRLELYPPGWPGRTQMWTKGFGRSARTALTSMYRRGVRHAKGGDDRKWAGGS